MLQRKNDLAAGVGGENVAVVASVGLKNKKTILLHKIVVVGIIFSPFTFFRVLL